MSTLGPAKASGIIVVSDELLTLSQPGSEALLRDEMAKGVGAFLDAQFVDPSVTEVVGESPASITNGVTPIASTGPTATNAATDLGALIAAFVAGNPNVESAVLLLSPTNAIALAATGHYKDLTITGGTLAGVPVVTSAALGKLIILFDPMAILLADGGIEIDVSRHATLQMDSAPTDPPVDATVMQSLWQRNLVGLRAERFVNWKRARLSAVQYISGASYV